MGPGPPDEATSRNTDGASLALRRPVFVVQGSTWPGPRRWRSSRRSARSSREPTPRSSTEYRGLTVGELAELRGALRPAGAEFKIFKNTLARRAAEEAGLPDLVPMLGARRPSPS